MSEKLKEYGILFNGEMVEAIRGGIKTQTRSPMRIQPPGVMNADGTGWGVTTVKDKLHWIKVTGTLVVESFGPYFCPPYGYAGDGMWVRETWADIRGMGFGNDPVTDKAWEVAYRAGIKWEGDEARKAYGVKWKPSIHMPRWASRIDLLTTQLRRQRLREITEAEVALEGSPGLSREEWGARWDKIYASPAEIKRTGRVIGYISYLWDGDGSETVKFNGLPHIIHRNPLVWVYDFEVIV